MLVNTKQRNRQLRPTSVTDDLFVHSTLPPATKTHSSYQVKLQKKGVKSTQKQPSCKKRAAHEKVVKSKVAAQKRL